MTTNRRTFLTGASATVLLSASGSARAQTKPRGKYDVGATDNEIKIGHFCSYTGPTAEYGVIGKAHEAFWKSVNNAGGINGRKVNFVTRDDGYVPSKSLEVTRELVEQEKVLCLFNPLGTPTNTAIQSYMNENKVPHLFLSSGASKWGNPKDFPWTMGFQPDYRFEASSYVNHARATVQNPKFGVLMQNDEYGQDYYAGIRDLLGEDSNSVDPKSVKVMPYDVTDGSIDAKIVELKEFGANVFINISTPKFAVQAIRKAADIGWKPVHYLNNVSLSDAAVMKPAGFDNCQGIITGAYLKDAANPVWDKDADMAAWRAWMAANMPDADPLDGYYVFAYAVASLMKETLRRCGDDLTRANLMKQATNLKDLRIPLLLPKVLVNTSPSSYYPIKYVQLSQFRGRIWSPLGGFIRNERNMAEPTNEASLPETKEKTTADK